MKTLRRAISSCVALLIALFPMNAGAVSIFDGVKTRPAPIAPVVIPQNLPVLPQLPSTVVPSLGLDAVVPLAPVVPVLPSVEVPNAAAPQAANPGAQASLEKVDAALAAPGADQAGTLDAAFDAGIRSHIDSAVSEFFPTLAPSEQPGVVVSTKKLVKPDGAPTDAEMEGNVKSSPKTNPEREQIAIKLFQNGGAKYDAATAVVSRPDFTKDGVVQVQEVKGFDGSVRRNIFVVKKGKLQPGQKERVIVITSHNDKVDVGDGVIDNWTGTTMVAHLYASIKDRDTSVTYVFAAFAREEEGLVGSKTFYRSMTADQRAQIELNHNLDTFAIKGGETHSWINNSDEEWLDAIDAGMNEGNKKLPAAEQIAVTRANLNGGDADSSTARRNGILAGTIFAGDEDLIFSIIHSANDNFGAFDFLGYKNVYRLFQALFDWHERNVVTRRSVGAS